MYELGALRALEDSLEGVDFTAMDSYVGVSAGSFIASCLANGMSPKQLVRAIVRTEPGEHPFHPGTFFVPAYREWARRASKLPSVVADVLTEIALPRRGQRPTDALMRLARALPVGVFDNEPIRRYMERIFSLKGRTDDFRKLHRRLTVVAADLESGHTVLFGRPGWDDIPISRAVQASTAVPGLYPPVLIEGRYCVDGALLRTVHASVALEDGVDLLLAINPIVPVDITPAVREGLMRRGALVEAGLSAVLSQTFRTLVHSRMTVGMGRYAHAFPHADVVLFEPARDEYAMFFANMFSFRARRRLCELAYDATRRDLLARRRALAPVLTRHGLRLREDVLRDPERDVWAGMTFDDESAAEMIERFDDALDELAEVAMRN